MILGVPLSSRLDDAELESPPHKNAIISIVINHLQEKMSRQYAALCAPINRNGLPDVKFPNPFTLKACNDRVGRAGKTVNSTESSIEERLAKGKKATLVFASSGIFSEGPWKGWDSAEPYPGQILGIIAIEDIHRACRGHEHTPLAIHAIPKGDKAVEGLEI